ncbi:MAG: alanine racemase [Clostridium sp.]|nr:alanine racemase [Clostridium sp.]
MDDRQKECLQKIAADFETPTYVFDARILSERVSLIRDMLPKDTTLCFAMKANPFLTGTFAKLVDRLEVCSPGEYEICIREQIDPEMIVVSGVNKTPASLERIFSYSHGAGIYTIESELHYRILKQCADKCGKRLKVLLRLSSGNQFGMDEASLTRMLSMIQADDKMDVIGIHYYAGTQKNSKKIESELQLLDAFGDRLRKDFNIENPELEYGPGLMVSYFENAGDSERKEADASAQLHALNELLTGMDAYRRISIELGRFLVSTCGYYMTQVMDIKHTGKTNFAIVDGGIHQINYYGQMMGMKKPYISLLKMSAADHAVSSQNNSEWTICGSLCTVNDVLVRQIALEPFDTGDILVFERCGAYSITEGMAMFLSRELPQALLIDYDGNTQILRKKTEINTLNGRMEE